MANEKRLISVDAHELEELLSDCFDVIKSVKTTHLSLMGALQVWIGRCKGQPTVDAVEVVHGRWIKTEVGSNCSMCGLNVMSWYGNYDGYEREKGICLMHYCPNCGAKMDRGE